MRRSFSPPRRVGTVCCRGSPLRARTTYTSPASVSATKTMNPAHVPIASAAIAIAAKYPTLKSRNRYASASLLNGLIIQRP
jgi:hypothetical protein